MHNPVKRYFPAPVTWPGIMLLGAAGSILIGAALPTFVKWVASKIPPLQKTGAAASTSTTTTTNG